MSFFISHVRGGAWGEGVCAGNEVGPYQIFTFPGSYPTRVSLQIGVASPGDSAVLFGVLG